MSGEGQGQPDAGAHPMDLITLLQHSILKQAATIYNFLGALQQKAPAEVTITDAIVNQVPEDPEWEATCAMPKTIISQMHDLQQLIDALPAQRSQEEDMEEIAVLLKRHGELEEELKQEMHVAGGLLHSGHLVCSELGMHSLEMRRVTATGGGGPNPAAAAAAGAAEDGARGEELSEAMQCGL